MQLADGGGNRTGNFIDTIYLDNAGPTVTISPSSTTVKSMVIVSITGTDAGAGLQSIYYQAYLNSGACPSAGDAGYIVYPSSFMLPGSPNQTITRKVCSYGIDVLGNTGQIMSGIYIIDNEPPHGAFVINSGARRTNTPYVRIQGTFNDAIQMRFINDGDSRGSWETYNNSKARTLNT